MPKYVIGDIQGCFAELTALLSLFEFNPNFDKVYLVGDLVNRGPSSLEVLRFAYLNQTSINFVLGNHDLHLLACWSGVAKTKSLDTLDSTLAAEDIDHLMHWLRQQPLLIDFAEYVVVHAGINPAVDFNCLVELANFCQEKLSGSEYLFWLSNMYGNAPLSWSNNLTDVEKFRFGINSLTRMRMLNGTELDFKFKGDLAKSPNHLIAWFDLPATCRKKVIFGHWSALGLIVNEKIIALDTGCIWGGQLTAVRLEDGAIFQTPAEVCKALEME